MVLRKICERAHSFLPPLPGYEYVIVVAARDDVGGQPSIRKRPRDRRAEAHRRQAGMHRQADPRPVSVGKWRDQRHAFGLMDQRENPSGQRRVGIEHLDGIGTVIEDRPHLTQKLREIGYSPWLASHCSSHLIV